MNLKTTFLILCVLGTLLPLSQFMPWVIENGLDVQLFFKELFSCLLSAAVDPIGPESGPFRRRPLLARKRIHFPPFDFSLGR